MVLSRAVASALFLFVSLCCFAQDRGTITGSVTDPSGAGIPDAKVTIKNPATNFTQEVTTAANGNYSVPNLSVGTYTIQVEKTGFQSAKAETVQVNVNTSSRIDIKLAVGDVATVVDVAATTPLLQTDRSDLGNVVSNKAIMDLPLFIGGGLRDNLAFVSTVPGVTGDVGNPRIGGGLLAGASLLLDGAESNSERRNDAGFQAVSTEAIQEFKVQTGTYSAEYGRTANGVVNFTTKSGTNELHGDGFYFNRNEAFNARQFTYSPGTRQISRQHLFGGVIGGPVFIPKVYDGRNKAFFFFSYEKSRFRSGSPSNQITLPIQDFRNGDFRRLTDADGNPIPLYDPFDASGNFIADPRARPRMACNGVLNVICPGRIDPTAKLIQDQVPLPDNPNQVFNNTRAVGTPGNDQNVYSIKGDYTFSERSRISGLFSRQFFGSPPQIGPVPGTLGEGFTSTGINKYYRVSHDFIFRPNLINHINFGHNRRDTSETAFNRTSGDFRDATLLKGVTGGETGMLSEYRIPFFGGSALGKSIETTSPSRTWSVNEQLTWVKGRHTVKFGFQFLQANYARLDCNGCSGIAEFSDNTTGNPGVNGITGSDYASFLLGLASTGSFNYGANIEFRFPYYAWYVQDDWKVTNKLTLNIGLRYDLSFPKQEKDFQNSNFNPSIPNPGAGGLLGALEFAGNGPGRSGKTRLQDTRKNGFGPRIGFAYQLFPKTVIRGGGAIFYTAMREDGNADNGVQGFGGSFSALENFVAPNVAFQLSNGFNQFGGLVDARRPPKIDPSLVNFQSPTYMTGQAGRAPMFYDYNFTVEHAFTGNTLFRAGYHATIGAKLLNNRQSFNQLDPRYWDIFGNALSLPLSEAMSDPRVIAAGFQLPFAGYPMERTLSQALRPYPQYNSLNTGVGGENSGHSTYHALETSFEHRFNSGLYFLGSYTFSKLLTNVEGENPGLGGFVGDAQAQQQNQYNRKPDKSVSNQDTPHTLVLSYVYELPVGKGKKFLSDMHPVANALIGNWKVSGVHRYQSGRPLRVISDQDLFGAGGRARASFVQGVPLKNPNFDPTDPTSPYINPAAFRRPNNAEYGDTPPLISQLRGFALYNEDISILKNFYIGRSETRYFEFRASAFNIANRHRLGDIEQNMDNSATFGTIKNPQINSPREIQFGLKFYF